MMKSPLPARSSRPPKPSAKPVPRKIYAGATHGVLCGSAVERLASIDLAGIMVTNTVEIPAAKRLPNLQVLSIAELMAAAIARIHTGESIGDLFEKRSAAALF
jgi:ribose-phosphate pyrophosphokinase